MTKVALAKEIYEINNFVHYLKQKFNADTKEPIEISSALTADRIVVALRDRFTDLIKANAADLTVSSIGANTLLAEMSKALSNLGQKYSEDVSANLSDPQKQFLVERVKKLEIIIHKTAGKVFYMVKDSSNLSEIQEEEMDLLLTGKKVYDEYEKEMDRREALRLEKGIPDDEDLDDEDLEPASEAEESNNANLAEINQGKVKKNSKAKAIISENIDE